MDDFGHYGWLCRFLFPLHVKIRTLIWLMILHSPPQFYYSTAELRVLVNSKNFTNLHLCFAAYVGTWKLLVNLVLFTGFQEQIHREQNTLWREGYCRTVREQMFRKHSWEQVSYCQKSCFIHYQTLVLRAARENFCGRKTDEESLRTDSLGTGGSRREKPHGNKISQLLCLKPQNTFFLSFS